MFCDIIIIGSDILNILKYFMLFIIYSFIGWVIEIINEIITEKRFVNRGFLIGPYCPIYGIGVLLMTLMLTKYIEDPIVVFIMSVVIFSILEYFTSYIMEKLFKARWWDYTNRKFNINGRICLETMIPFGIGGIIVMYGVNPLILKVINMIPNSIFNVLAIILLVIFIIDNFISFNIILGFRKITFKAEKDNTLEITKKVKEILSSKSLLGKRLIKSFPNLKVLMKRNK